MQEIPTPHIEEEMTIRDLFSKFSSSCQYILSKWPIVLLFCTLGGALGFTYAYFDKPVYSATTTFVLEGGEGTGGAMSQYAGIASMVGLDLGGSGGGIFQGDNIIELYKSRTMIEKALLSHVNGSFGERVIDRYIRFKELNEKLDKDLSKQNLTIKVDSLFVRDLKPDSKENRLRDSIINFVFTDINKNFLTIVKPDKKLSIIKVDVKAKDEGFAKILNEELVKNVNEFYIQTKTKKSLANIAILKEKVDSVRSVMNGAIYSAAAVNDATPNLNLTRQVQKLAPIQRSQFTAETNKAMLTELIKNLELSKLSLLKETPLIQVIDKPIFPLEMERLSKVFTAVKGAFIFGIFIIGYLLLKRMPKF